MSGSIEAAPDRIEMPIYWKGTTVDIEQFTDDEIITPDTVRKRPCISEGGGCHIVSSHTVFGDGGHIAATDKVDADVFATAAEAYKWARSMSGRRGDSCPVQRHAYSVRFHTIDWHRQPEGERKNHGRGNVH